MLKRFVKILITFFILPALCQLCTRYEWAKRLENMTIDLRYWLRGQLNEKKLAEKTNKSIPKIIYVNTDDNSLKIMGESPVPFSFYAQAIYALVNFGKPQMLVSDIMFCDQKYSSLVDPQRVQSDRQTCRQFFEHSSNVILGAWYNAFGDVEQPFSREERPFPLLYKGFTRFNLIQNPLYPDNQIVGNHPEVGLINCDSFMNISQITRWIPLYARSHDHIYYTLGLKALLKHLKVSDDLVNIYGDDSINEKFENKFQILCLNENGQIIRKIPLVRRQLMEINWFSSWESSSDEKISLIQISSAYESLRSNKASQKEKKQAQAFLDKFKGSIVFLCDTYKKASSLIHTPIDSGKVPSITAHANLFKTLYWETYLRHPSGITDFCILFILNFFVASITLYSEFFGRFSHLLILFVALYFVLALGAFGSFDPMQNWVLPMVSPLLCIFIFLMTGTLYQLFVERKQRLRLKNIFGTYLDPELVTRITKTSQDPQLGGVEKNITAFFSDIQNFSTFSELLEPTDLVRMMNEYLTASTNIIQEEGGTLDKYIGDAVVAMFGAPFDLENHAVRACLTACRIQDHQEELRKKWQRDNSNWPQGVLNIRTRIGLNTGMAVVGNMGSSTRFAFTMMGDTVNIASRCESGAKQYGVYTLVTEDIYKPIVAASEQFLFRFIDRIVVKGRYQPLGIYELIGLKENYTSETDQCIGIFEKGIQKYLAQDWNGAIQLFKESAYLELLQPERDPNIPTNPSLVYQERCKYMQENPPGDDWDGVFVMKTK